MKAFIYRENKEKGLSGILPLLHELLFSSAGLHHSKGFLELFPISFSESMMRFEEKEPASEW